MKRVGHNHFDRPSYNIRCIQYKNRRVSEMFPKVLCKLLVKMNIPYVRVLI